MKFSNNKFLGLLGVAAISFVLAAEVSLRSALDWLLIHEAEVTAMDWAHHIQRNIPQTKENSKLSAKKFEEAASQFETILHESVTVGSVFQADFVNLHCHCMLSIGEYDPSVVGNRHHSTHGVASSRLNIAKNPTPLDEKSHDVRDHSSNSQISSTNVGGATHKQAKQSSPFTKKKYARNFVEHVFANRKNLQHLGDNTPKGFPVDRQLLDSLAQFGLYKVRVHHNVGGNNPSVLGELYHPMIVEGETNYYLRFLINLDAPAARFKEFLYSGALGILILLGIAFFYPIRKIINATQKQRAASERAHFLANKDSLTNLANRNALQSVVPEMIEACADNRHSLGVLLVDVNNFKEINDFFGYKAGDQALIHVSEILRKHAPEGSFIARTGGDEFAIFAVCDHINCVDFGRILDSDSMFSYDLEGKEYTVDISLSKGFARYPEHGETLNVLMQHVDLAMHNAKADGSMDVVTFKRDMAVRFNSRVAMFKEFRSAIESSDIVPYYQPLVEIETGRLVGFEALARWKHPEKGILSPAVFFEALADREINALLGSEMLRVITSDMGKWKKTKVAFESVGFNVGEGDLLRPGFVLDVTNAISQNGLLPRQLAVEVTENSIFGKNKKISLAKLEQLRELGCYVALDDFGTGYSSITHLKDTPCSAVKVDKTFVDKVTENKADQAIITALLELGQSMGFKLVLEGVETQEQADILSKLGCTIAQGFLYAKPMPAEEVPIFIAKLQNNTAKKTAAE